MVRKLCCYEGVALLLSILLTVVFCHQMCERLSLFCWKVLQTSLDIELIQVETGMTSLVL